MPDQFIFIVLMGSIVAGAVQGLSGFAFSLVALSIWSWSISPQLAAPMAVFGSLVGQLTALPMLWRGIDFRRVWPFVAGGILGVPLGSAVLPLLEPGLFRLALGVFLVVYCPAMLAMPRSIGIAAGGRLADAAAGLVGGVLGGLAGLAGPAPTVWTTLRGWDKDRQRGVLQGFNIAMHVTTLTSYMLTGRLAGTFGVFSIMAPAIVLPTLAGAMLFRRLSTGAFRRVILALLMASGVALLASAAGH